MVLWAFKEVLVYSRGRMTLQSFKFVDGSHEPTGVHPPVGGKKSILSAFNWGWDVLPGIVSGFLKLGGGTTWWRREDEREGSNALLSSFDSCMGSGAEG